MVNILALILEIIANLDEDTEFMGIGYEPQVPVKL